MAKTLLEMLRMPKGMPALSRPPGPPRLVKKPAARGVAWPAANLGKFLTPRGGK
jgi:hypothetical protein